MRDEEDGLPHRFLQAEELVLQPSARDRVEGAEGLVHEQHLGVTGERPRDPDALALTARELSGIALAVLRRVESHQVEELVDALTDPLLRPAEQVRHDGRVPGHRHVREEADLLDHVADVAAKLRRVERPHAGVVEQDVALVDVDEPVHHLHRGRLAAAGRPDEDADLTRLDAERQVVEGIARLSRVALRRLAELDRGGAAAVAPVPSGHAGIFPRRGPPPRQRCRTRRRVDVLDDGE